VGSNRLIVARASIIVMRALQPVATLEAKNALNKKDLIILFRDLPEVNVRPGHFTIQAYFF